MAIGGVCVVPRASEASMTDPLADMITRIRNAYAVGKPEVRLPFSRLKAQVADILVREGYLEHSQAQGRLPKRILVFRLKYISGNPAAEDMRMISRPSRRIYRNAKGVRPTRYGFGITILSTSQGLMTDREAKKANVGGEVLCEIW